MSKNNNTLILGIGNELLCDEGVGIHAIRALKERNLPGGIVLLELGTAILDAIPFIEKADNIIVIDAMEGDGCPGTVYRTDIDNCSENEYLTSMHGFDINSVMVLAGKKDIIPITVFGVEPEKIDWSLELSSIVDAALGPLVDTICKEL